MSEDVECYCAVEPNGPLKPWKYSMGLLNDHDVQIKITYCGMCGSDLHMIDNEWSETEYPIVPGHEIVGNVVAMGRRVQGFQLGDVVGVGPQVFSCGKCKQCLRKNDQHCYKKVLTYNDKQTDGTKTYGGFSDVIQSDCRYVFKIPANIPNFKAAPLLCAGATVFSALKRFAPSRDNRVGILGIGGLGHLGIQFSRAFGHHVTALSHTESKKNEAVRLGAREFILTSAIEQLNKAKNSLDLILATASSELKEIDRYLQLLDKKGIFVLIGVSPSTISFNPKSLVFDGRSIASSLIASREEMNEMFNMASSFNILPEIELFEMSKVNDAISALRNGNVHYRAVLCQTKKD